jgi:uncharacterized membrane protein YvbJ
MSYCPKCGNKVEETMMFCPKCGASLKSQTPPDSTVSPQQYYQRNEKAEKQEKNQNNEKREKGEFGYMGWLIGGLILIIIGFFGILSFYGFINSGISSAALIVTIGIVILVFAVFIMSKAKKQNPAVV